MLSIYELTKDGFSILGGFLSCSGVERCDTCTGFERSDLLRVFPKN